MKHLHSDFALNFAIGFLSLLLLILMVGLFSRIVYPRIITERSGEQTHLISQIIQIEVLNGCGAPGIASDYTRKLRANGFDVVDSGNFDNFDVRQTMIIDRAGNRENAQKIARALGIDESRIIEESSDDFYLDATVVIGADYDQLKL